MSTELITKGFISKKHKGLNLLVKGYLISGNRFRQAINIISLRIKEYMPTTIKVSEYIKSNLKINNYILSTLKIKEYINITSLKLKNYIKSIIKVRRG